MSKIKFDSTEALVLSVLENYPFTRNSDQILECVIVEQMGFGEYSFSEIMMRRRELGIPKFSTIERVRRKLQSKYPNLKANEVVTQARMDLQAEYKQYAKNGCAYQ
ncbi:hypothetical protein ACWG0P_08940 [Amedibacillus sp. YH-ame6]